MLFLSTDYTDFVCPPIIQINRIRIALFVHRLHRLIGLELADCADCFVLDKFFSLKMYLVKKVFVSLPSQTGILILEFEARIFRDKVMMPVKWGFERAGFHGR